MGLSLPSRHRPADISAGLVVSADCQALGGDGGCCAQQVLGKGRVTARPLGGVCLQGKSLVHIPRSCLLADRSRGINLGADRIARRAIALALNRLTESAGAASGAVMLRTVLVRVGFRGLDALLCLQGGKRELPGARQPALALAYISWICLW